MNLLEIRKWFIQDSGRFDLVGDPNTCEVDNGADKYINSGIRLINRLLDYPKQNAIALRTLQKGEHLITVPRFQAINHVWIEVDDGVKYLTKMEFNELQQKFPIGHVEEGTPSVYSLGIKLGAEDGTLVRLVDDDGNYITDEDGNYITTSIKRGSFQESVIFIMAPADRNISIRVVGRFPASALNENEEFNFWTTEHPETVVQAALYSLERFYRNTQGMRDHMEAIRVDIQGIDNDVVEQSIAETDQMDSSFNERTGRGRRYES